MTDFITMLRKAFNRSMRNPFTTPKAQARKLVEEMENQGLRVVSTEELAAMAAPQPAPEPEQPQQLTRPQQARQFYYDGDFEGLYAFKKTSKVSWERLGFTREEEMEIIRNKPA